MLGILGGMGPAATADFFAKLIALTPANIDQEHIPLVLSCLPQTPDRSAAILGQGPSPLPNLLAALRLLGTAGAQAIVIPCNTSHHWYDELQAASEIPILHIADAAIAALPPGTDTVAILATRGTLTSGFYQRKLETAGYHWRLSTADREQSAIDAVIAQVKGGAPDRAAEILGEIWANFTQSGVGAVLMACTEIPLASSRLPPPPFAAIDTSLELARSAVTYALARGWNHRPDDVSPSLPPRR